MSWFSLFRYRQIWGMMAGFFCVIWIWNIFITFLPLYLQEARGVSIAASGWLAGAPYFGAAVLGISGGYVMTRYAKHSERGSLTAKRHVVMGAAVIAGVLVCLIPFVASLPLALVVMTFALGMLATMQAGAWAMPGDIVNNSQIASVEPAWTERRSASSGSVASGRNWPGWPRRSASLLGHNLTGRHPGAKGLDVAFVGLDELLSRSDYVVVCAALTPQTVHLIDRPRLAHG